MTIRKKEFANYDRLSMVDAIESLVVIYDNEDRIVFVNTACCTNLGYQKAEMLSSNVHERLLVDGETHHGYHTHLNRPDMSALDIYTNRWRASDGTYRIINWVNRPLCDQDGDMTHIVATGNDITELQLGEEQIMLNAEQQEIMNTMLHIGMEELNMQQKLRACLQSMMTARWIGEQFEVAIFLVDDTDQRIDLGAQSGTTVETRKKMTSADFNASLCDEAIRTGNICFADVSMARSSGSKKPYYSVPVKSGKSLEAVIVMFLDQSHEQDLGEIVFLHTLANTIASVISRHRIDSDLKRTQENLKTAQHIAEMGSWELHINSRTLYLSDEALNILGLEPGNNKLHLESFYSLIHNDDIARVSDIIDTAIMDYGDIETRLRLKSDIDPLVLIIIGRMNVDDDTQNLKIVGTIQDISRRLLAEQEQQLISNVFDGSQEGITVLDSSSRIMRVNKAFTDITGYTETEIENKFIDILNSERQDEQSYNEMWSSVEANGSWCGELLSKKKNGELFTELRTISIVKDSHGQIERYLVLSMDMSLIKQSEERIHQLVYYDALTQLPNKSMFKSVLSESIEAAEQKHEYLAVLSLGLDGLVRINDSLGHSSGDKMLNMMADRLRQCVRTIDTVCRWGGDSFLVLLADIKRKDNAISVANKILNTMIEPVNIADKETVVIGTSIGISMYPQHSCDAMALIQNADVAMHKAKADGGNRYHIYSDEMNVDVLERLSIESGLRQALEEEQFELYYQPLVRLSDNRIIGAEALIRWIHPTKGMIPPDQFIPVAEESGLIIPIGEWVIREACRQCSDWNTEGHDHIDVSINLSARQFRDPNLADMITDAMQQNDLDPSSIMLEITESSVMESVEHTIDVLQKLKDTGIRLSIDDFGTGYSSLAYLKRYPIDKLKIDRSFVQHIHTNLDDRTIVQTIIDMGHNMNMEIVAEGVENIEHMEYLASHGCEYVQGYHLSRPLSILDFKSFAEQHRDGVKIDGDAPGSNIHILR